MDLASRLLFGLARLAALGQSGLAQIEVESPGALLGAAFGGLLSTIEAGAAEQAFGAGTTPERRRAAFGQLARGLERALRDPAGYQPVDALARAIEALLLVDGVARTSSLGLTRLRFGELALFQALRLLRMSFNTTPPTLLVGILSTEAAPVEIPLQLAPPLHHLALRYEAAVPAPHWQTDLWVRVPPDPNKRRLEEWPRGTLERAGRIELYRQRIPGPDPAALITNESVAFPHELSAGPLTLELLDQSGRLVAIRTTIRDKFQAPLAIVERVVAHEQGAIL